MEDECGFPTLYPSLSGDPNIVRNKMNDSDMKTHIIAQHYFSQQCITDTVLSKTKPSSKSSVIYDDYVLTSESYGSLDTGTKRHRPQKGYISKARHILRYGDPDPKLRFVPSPRPAHSTLPPRLTFEQSKEKAAIRRALIAAATAEIEARSARYLAAAPRIPRYWEDPSKKKASEAAATSTEGQAEAGGPVLKSACEDPNPCAADLIKSTSTMDDSEMKTHIIAEHYFSQPHITDTMLSKTKPSSKSSVIYDDFVLTSESYGSLDTGTKRHRPQEGYISKARHILRYGDPDPKLRFVPSPRPADSTLPPRLTFEQSKAKAAIRRALIAAATAEIEARSARYLAAAPRIPRYWEDPSKKKASEAAATSTEGQAEAGGPVLKSAGEDPNPCAADLIKSTSTMDDSEMKTHIIAEHYFSQPHITDTMLSKTKPSSKSSVIYDDFVLTSESYGSLDTGTKRHCPQKGYISKARHILRYGDPDPKLRFVPSPRPADSTLPPRLTFEQSKAKAAIRRALIAAATAEIEARSARYLAAAPRIPRYWEDPSKKKASEAAATSTEGQAEAGGPVPKSACEDPNPCAADLIRSTSTLSI